MKIKHSCEMSTEHHLLTASVQAEVVSKLIRLHFRSVKQFEDLHVFCLWPQCRM